MNITNVVLDRDKEIVTFDDNHSVNIQRDVLWAGEHTGWIVNEGLTALWDEEIDNRFLSLAQKNGLSLENLSVLAESTSEQEPTPDYYNKTFKGIKLDPYRVCKIYDINGGPREHIIKKLLRGVNKNDGINTELDLISVVEGQLKRWKEMLKEDAE